MTEFNGDVEMIAFVQGAVGSLLGTLNEQVLFFMYGIGRNAKTTFQTAIEYILGSDLVRKTHSDLLMLKGFETQTSDVAQLKGKRIAFCSELTESKRFDEVRVKDLTGGDTISARRLYANYETFKPTFVLWIAGNSKPSAKEQTEGFWRRFVMIPFEAVITKDEEVPLNLLLESFKQESSTG